MVPVSQHSQQSITEQFRQAMAQAGIQFSGEIVADNDKITRFTVDGDRNKSLTGWYTFYTDGVPAGEFGCWKRGIQATWCSKSESALTQDELDALYRKRKENEERRKAEAEARYAEAEAKANSLWNAATPCESHPYLTRKGVASYGLRLSRWTRETSEGKIWLDIPNALLVPIKIGKRIVSLQAIFPDKNNFAERDKDFLPGGRKAGAFFAIGKPPSPDDVAQPIFVVCEGYSTGATIHAATGFTVLVSFDAGNIERVAVKLREKYPHARIIIAADNDRWTTTPVDNPGVTFATKAAAAVRGELLIPEFTDLESRPTDFNDLAAQEGIEAVRDMFIPPAANDNAPAPSSEVIEAETLGPLTTWLMNRTKAIRVIGCDEEDGVWLRIEGKSEPKHLTVNDLLKKSNLLNLMQLTDWEALIIQSQQGERFSCAHAASAIMAVARELPVYKLPPKVQVMASGDQLTGIQGQDSALLARKLRALTLYDLPSQSWYRWQDVWCRMNEEVVRMAITEIADRDLCGEYDNRYVNGTLALLKTRLSRVSDNVSERGDEVWETDRNLLPMRNGVLDLETREIVPHAPDYMFNWLIPHNYDPKATCPVTQKFIHRLAGGDPSTEAVLYAFLSAVLHGRYDLERYLEFVGMAGTGKSTYISLCKELVGAQNVHSTDMKTLHNNQFETANIYGKRLVMISDADKYGGDIGIFKSMTGRDVIRREEKNRQAQSGFVYHGMVIVAANNPIQFADTSTAMVRRRVPVHIDKKLDKTEVDYKLAENLAREIPGLINLLLESSQDDVTAVLSDYSNSRKHAAMRALVDTNNIAAWANETLIQSDYGSVPVGRLGADADMFLYPSFARYCEQTGRRGVVALNTFTRSLQDVLATADIEIVAKRKNTGTHIQGVRLRTDNVSDNEIPPLFSQY